VLERRQYFQHPPRHEYALTPKGAELCDVLVVMARWGDRWLAGEAGPPVLHRHWRAGTSRGSSCTARSAATRSMPRTSTCSLALAPPSPPTPWPRERLGHANMTVTAQIRTHKSTGNDAAAAAKIAELILRPSART
jgi:integrase